MQKSRRPILHVAVHTEAVGLRAYMTSLVWVSLPKQPLARSFGVLDCEIPGEDI